MADAALYPRYAELRLAEALEESPIVLIQGPRQCGKTTLAQIVGSPRGLTAGADLSAGEGAYSYVTFDDDIARSGAETDPMGFIAGLPERAALDEVQRVPGIFTALKLAVDRDRTPGRFLLTGSTNVLQTPNLADSLAGRMETVRLHPLAQCELAERPGRPERPEARLEDGRFVGFLDALFEGGFETRRSEPLGAELHERIVDGGYPAALARRAGRRRAVWYRDYVEAQMQRDVRDMSRIRTLEALPRLMRLAAVQTATLLNVSDLARSFELSLPTVRSYLELLERVFLLERLPPWHSNRLSRLIKTPKLHIGDTGLACALMGLNAAGLARDPQRRGAPARDIRLSGAAPSGRLVRRAARFLPLPRQGQGGGGHRDRAGRDPSGGRGGQGGEHGFGGRFPRPASAARGERRAVRRRRGAARRRDLDQFRRRSLCGANSDAVGGGGDRALMRPPCSTGLVRSRRRGAVVATRLRPPAAGCRRKRASGSRSTRGIGGPRSASA